MINDYIYYGVSCLLVVGIMLGLSLMGKVKTSVIGNQLSATCVAIAIPLTLAKYNALDISLFFVMLVSIVASVIWAQRIKMIAMPQTVALLNGLGGASSALVGIILLAEGTETSLFSIATAGFAIAVGMITLTGSIVAVGKLSGWLSQKPTIWPLHSLITTISFVLSLLSVCVIAAGIVPLESALICVAVSGFFGVAFAVRVGGANMPITISLLNSLSGVAVAAAGMAMGNPLLTSVGGIIGTSGLVLTQIMCTAMNRKLSDILFGKAAENLTAPDEHAVTVKEDLPELDRPDYKQLLRKAKRTIIVPGYGMAVAQAQTLIKDLSDKLEANGASVSFAIHPVAGRMPGHMNVLLAEVDIPYEKLRDIDDINPEFAECDVVIVVGANDVINPAARDAVGTPIYGMPILEVDLAKHIIICNYDDKPGYAGVENPLYHSSKAVLLQGDAVLTLKELINNVL